MNKFLTGSEIGDKCCNQLDEWKPDPPDPNVRYVSFYQEE